MQQAFAAYRHAPQRFAAVDWKALPSEEQRRYYDTHAQQVAYFRPLTAGECGCYASHLVICEQLLNSDAPWALVLEDDVEPESHFDSVLDSVSSLPGEWDIIKLIGRRKDVVINTKRIQPGLELVQFRKMPNLASAYLLSREGARKLLASRVPFVRPIDVDMRWWWDNDLRVFGLQPYCLRLSSTSDISSIGDRRGHRDWRSRWRKSVQTLVYNVGVWAHRSRQQQHWALMTQRTNT
jgi:glycosyl transferase, family 25